MDEVARWIKGRGKCKRLCLGWADSTVVTWLRNRIGDAAFKRTSQDEDIRLVVHMHCFPITYHRTEEQKQRLVRLSETKPRPIRVARSKVSSTLLAKIAPIDETASRVAGSEEE